MTRPSSSSSSTSTSVPSLPRGGHWCTIQSTPTTFNALLQLNGITGAHVQEIFSLEDMFFEPLKQQPVHGFIFLLQPQARYSHRVEPEMDSSKVYFANQVIPDACGTQALLSIVMNASEIEIGPMLNDFKEFTAEFDPLNKGLAITNCDQLRENHNSLAPKGELDPTLPLSFLAGPKQQQQQQGSNLDCEALAPPSPAFHYVAYVHVDDYVWELDGLQSCPIRRSDQCGDRHWLDVAREVLMARMQVYQETGGNFVLMAVVKDPIVMCKEKLEKLEKLQGEEVESLGGGEVQGKESATLDNKIDAPSGLTVSEEAANLKRELASLEKDRREEAAEIEMMRFDYRPAIAFMLKVQLENDTELQKKVEENKKKRMAEITMSTTTDSVSDMPKKKRLGK